MSESVYSLMLMSAFGLRAADSIDNHEDLARPVWQIKCSRACVESNQRRSVMPNHKYKKCAHIPCRCEVTNGDKYCGQACRDAGSEEVEIACDCSHPACPLT